MTHRIDVARGRDVVARWRDLAEQRLEYLTELFETGRWRRFHSELAFLENIQEAKDAVQAWRDLSTREAAASGNSTVNLSWLGHVRTPLPPRSVPLRDQVDRRSPQSSQIAVEPLPPVSMSMESERGPSEDAPSIDDAAMPTLDIATIQERYPLLRNAL